MIRLVTVTSLILLTMAASVQDAEEEDAFEEFRPKTITVTMSWEVPEGTPEDQWWQHFPPHVRNECFMLAKITGPGTNYFPMVDNVNSWADCDEFRKAPVYKKMWEETR